MKRNQIIMTLKNASPALTSVAFSDDMGFEFSAIVPGGVIYAEPGMLLSYCGGRWPPDAWQGGTALDHAQRIEEFLLEKAWKVTAWEKLSLVELKQWLEEAENFRIESS